MALTSDELQSIVTQVLSALRTNSKTIDDLTPVTGLGSSDFFEISGGKKVSYTVLRDLITSMSSTDQDSLRNLIKTAEIRSITFNANSENSVTLVVTTNGNKIFTATCNSATPSKAGVMSATDKVKLQSAYDNSINALDKAGTASTTATNALNAVTALKESKGVANGIASLNEDGKVPASQLPGYVDDAVEFAGFVTGAVGMASTAVASAYVAFNTDTNTFCAAVRDAGVIRPTLFNNWPDAERFGELDTATMSGRLPEAGKIYVDTTTNKTYRWSGSQLVVIGTDLALGETSSTAFPGDKGKALTEDVQALGERIDDIAIVKFDGTFTGGTRVRPRNGVWFTPTTDGSPATFMSFGDTGFYGDESLYNDTDGAALTTKVFRCGTHLYRVDDNRLVEIGNSIKGNIINVNEMAYNTSGYTLQEAINAVKQVLDLYDGMMITFLDGEGKWQFYQLQTDGTATADVWEKAENWQKVGASDIVGNCFNVTVELPKADTTNPYYDLSSAIDAVMKAHREKLGLQITFAVSATSWKMYQYIGSTLAGADFLEVGNWLDLAGMSAGGESIININTLCGDEDYTLSTAIRALIGVEETTGIGYRKEGLVITYRRNSSPIVWETKQYQGALNDMTATNEAQWKDFGGGGGLSETTTEVEKDNELPVTSGGVHEAMQTQPIVDFNDESTADDIIFQGVNAKGDAVGNPIKVPRSSGSGTQSGSTLNIYPESQAVWGAFGSRITLRLAIKSVTFDGDEEILNNIKALSILDALTRIELWGATIDQPSSTSASDYKDYLTVDFTDFMTSASSKDFIIRATDTEGNTKNRTVTVTAVDVTCACIQTLNYSAATALEVGGREKSLPMYKFENNVSTKQGILVTTEMFYNGEWKVLGTATVVDSYSHNISVNPNNVFGGGETLEHGAYPIRIKGVDLASGVEGNTIYTAIMCVDSTSDEPLVALRYNDANNGAVRLYDSVSLDVAAYTPGKTHTAVEVYFDGKLVTTVNCPVGDVLNVSKQVQGYKTDGTDSFDIYAQSGSSKSETITLTVSGSVLDENTKIKEGALIAYDFSVRSNTETDKTISDGGYEMKVEGANWNSNGFCNALGETALRIAENVKAEIPWAPFGSSAIETSGVAFQMAFSTKSIRDKNAMLCSCYDPGAGAGFYIRGNEIVLSVANGTPNRQRVGFKCNEKVTIAIVVEPGSKYVTYNAGNGVGTNYSFVKLYVNGEECAAIGYQPGTNALRQNLPISFNSENGDFNLFYFMAYQSSMEWHQAFNNYLCKMSNVDAMIAEYDKENVLDTTGKPSMSLMAAKGIPYYVVVADQTTFDNFDYKLNNGTSTSDQFACTLYYYNPEHPELNFKAVNVLWRRQGTTSAQRPIKNDRFNFNKKNKATGLKATVTLLNPDDTTELGRKAITAAKHNKVLVDPNGFAVDIITVKVDYSDSSNANDCGVCDMMNATFRALGSDYQTPAQRAYDGTQDLGGGDVLTGIQMDHSTKNHPIACFRATTDTLQDVWFHAKGNWKEDKGEQTALGFKDTPGYNKGCLNYGDFIEFFGNPDETLAQTEARFKTTEGLDTDAVYLISQYCGRDYAIYRYKDNAWVRSTGSMKQVNGRWQITGDVLNPVSGYELLQYAGMDWWEGVSTVEDMMKMTSQKSSWVTKLGLAATEYPAWTFYFECMIDDDQLQEDLALGKKVPYDLFNMLRFFQSCHFGQVDGWEKTWRENAYRYMSMESCMAYTAFTDYLAAVDQRAKNMQPMFFLEDGSSVENGVYIGYKNMEPTRMYLNKVYDCDTCNGADNDGGRDIDAEVDPNKPTDEATGYSNPYMGSGSVLFNNMDKCSEVWNSNDLGATTISLKSVVNRMRNQTAEIGGKTMAPFSPDGALYFFVTTKLLFWPKNISSYDGERKYIDHTRIANRPYFYALHGLGLTMLPRFIEQRWAIRDGYYQTGDFFTNPIVIRAVSLSSSSKIHITAAATGYFGIGNDVLGQLSESVYLEAGESHSFSQFAHDAGAQLYLYQPARMSKVDISELSVDSSSGAQFAKCELVEEIVIGGAKHTSNPSVPGYASLSTIALGDLPFLKTLDVSNTPATSIDAKGCPRIETILANDTNLASCGLAQTSPISNLVLPDSITTLEFVNLPNLSYPGGLTLNGIDNVTRLWVEGCKNIDAESLAMSVTANGKMKEARIPGLNVTASPSALRQLMASGVIGLDAQGRAYDEAGQCSGLDGRWIMSELIEDEDVNGLPGLNSIKAYFPELTVFNSQFSIIVCDDIVEGDDCEKYSNPENQTGADYNKTFVASGHTAKILRNTHAYKCTYNSRLGQMEGEQLSDANFTMLADGSTFDIVDAANEGFDIMHHLPHHWYKGVNDYKNQRKYTIYSTTEGEPLSTANKSTKAKLSELLYAEHQGVYIDEAEIGKTIDDTILVENGSTTQTNIYRLNVEGMKQVRWPGLNDVHLGAVFTDAEGKIVGIFNMRISHSYFDFSIGAYVFCDVPVGAVHMYFTAFHNVDGNTLCLAVDSSSVEAIEPEWVEHTVGEIDSLIGTYPITIDGLGRPRSLSGAVRSRKGDGNSTTSSEWNLDENGDPQNSPLGTIHWTAKDFQNSTRRRGVGYQLQDYEQHKEISNLWWCTHGTTNEQARIGNGAHDATLNGRDSIGMADTDYVGNALNSCMGLKHYVGCDSEWMDYIAGNVTSYEEFYKRKCIENSADPVNYKFHIYDPITKTERVVQSVTGNGHCVARVVHGAKCDILASKVHSTDTSRYTTHYAAGHWFPGSRGRVVLRSGNNSNANCGLAYAYAYNASSNSGTFCGGRLAFRGKFVIVDKAK